MPRSVTFAHWYVGLFAVLAVLAVPPTAAAQARQEAADKAATGDNTSVVRTPAPGAVELEAAHVKRYDAAIAPVRDHALPAGDAERLRGAFSRISANDDAAARADRDAISDPIARKLVDWFRLRSGIGTVDEYSAFLATNSRWPNRQLMTRRMEEAMFGRNLPAARVQAAFKDRAPASAAGHAALAVARLEQGDKAGAKRHASIAWREHDLPASLESAYIASLGSLLTAEDHKWRLDRLLIDDIRWRGERRARANVARRMLKYLSEGEQKKAKARIAALERSRSAGGLLVKLPAEKEDQRDWGLEFHRIQDLRRRGKAEEAAKRLLKVPLQDKEKIVAPDEWWHERRSIAFELLEAGNPKLAYEVVKTAGALSVNPRKNQAFHAGWLALRYLGDANRAEQHFAGMREAADGPLTSAKAAYWLGRAVEAQAKKAKGGADETMARARKHYEDAAQFADTFHGQLARSQLGKSAAVLHVKMPAAPTPEQVESFRKLELPRAAVIAHRAGLPRHIIRTLLARMQLNQDNEAGIAMVAHLSQALGDTQMTVRIGKAGIARGHNLIVYSYPVHAFPSFKPLRQPPEMALLLGIARQESEFNNATKSGAGARGILQVMPITARHVCRDYRIKCDIGRLMKDELYNAMLGSAYIADRMGEFRGSYVLGIAGYNAGPGRARQWIREFGDPRDSKIDVIDWIHRIPFDETRAYVQKVLSNVQVYRARLAAGPVPIRVMHDLSRARDSQ